MVMILDVGGWKGVFSGLTDLLRGIVEEGLTGHAVVLALEFFVIVILTSAYSSLWLYASLSVGHSFTRGKKGFSILFAFVFYHAVQLLSTITMIVLSQADWTRYLEKFDAEPLKALPFMEGAAGVWILAFAGLCAVFYFITHHFLSKKLNLE